MAMMITGCAGWVGAVGTMTAYALASQGRLDVDSVAYKVVNAVGAGLLALSALTADNWPSLASNLVWMVIALLSLLRAQRNVPRALIRWARQLQVRLAFGPEQSHSQVSGAGEPTVDRVESYA